MQIGWIDYSDSAKQIALQILDALKEHQALDELGIGIVRDALANRLFPATSTLFTRAKYFFLVPYALRDLERAHDSNKTGRQLQLEYNDTEKELAIQLMKTTGIREGIFGGRTLRADFSGPWVKRGPGVVYWSSLRTLGILKDARMGYADYFNAVSQMASADTVNKGRGENGLTDDAIARASFWFIPNSEYRGWKDRLEVDLTQEEAAFLKSRIADHCPNSLYALLVNDSSLRTIANNVYLQLAERGNGLATNAYHMFSLQTLSQLPEALAGICKLGVDFSNVIFGCRIRYNTQIPAQKERANSLWADYAPEMKKYAEALDVNRLYGELGMMKHSGAAQLYRFLTEARECMLEGDLSGLDEAVRLRERRIKGGRAKIGRESQGDDSWIGGALLSYRFDVGMNIIREIEAAGGFDV